VFACLIGRGLELAPPQLEVQKYKLDGSLKIRYWGELIGASQDKRLIRAVGNTDQQIFGDYWLRDGDEYFEWYSSLKGYNILEIHERHSTQIKFWYCNLCCPARFVGQTIVWTDLALDLLVTPQKQFFLLDQDEFALLNLDWDAYAEVWKNVLELLKRFQE
jgi:protein associated with RNAse G/E